jgi:hypothetical protein
MRLSLCVLITFCLNGAAHAATPVEVNAAISRACRYLYSRQNPKGQWENDTVRKGMEHDFAHRQGDTFGGFTAVAVYALLSAGEDPQDARLQKAITFLENADMVGIYSLGLRANVWTQLPPTKIYREMSQRDAKLIILEMQTGKENPARGFWDYGAGHGLDLHAAAPRFDHSVSQYGVLGLWACAQNGVDIKRSVWEMIDDGWKRHQYPDGGWAYESAPPQPTTETLSMTAAGVATLFVTQEMLNPNIGAECRGNVADDHIERALDWIAVHFDEIKNAYGYYGVQRIGAASGRKYFGTIDWYAVGAEKLVKSQNADGSWIGAAGGMEDPIPCTAFSLLFLARGRGSVMMNKLQYDRTPADTLIVRLANWNERPRDIANLTHWVANRIERDLNWQIVTLRTPPDELHEAPIIYLGGDQDVAFTRDEEARLREFILGGGMVLANADCGSARSQFAASFEELGHRLFPAYSFRDLPAEHPIFSDEQYLASRWKSPPRLRGLSNGIREFMLLIPDADPARAWQLQATESSQASFQLGANIFLYAIDKKNLRNKGDGYTIHPDVDIIADRTARIGRLMIGDNWDPEPAGWQRMAALFHNRYKWDLNVENVAVGQKRLAQYKLLDLTGTTAFHLKADEREKLVDYVTHGGTLVIDAAGGSREFGDSAAEELTACFGALADKGLNTPLDAGSAVFNLPGAQISQVDYREWYRRRQVGTLKLPRLNGIDLRGRTAVFFSRQDLSGGLVGEPVDGISGYSPASATELMRNIVLYAGFGVRPGFVEVRK